MQKHIFACKTWDIAKKENDVIIVTNNALISCDPKFMMTSSNGNIFRVTGHLCGEFTGPGEFPAQRPVMRTFDVFFDLRLNNRLSKQSWGWWFEMQSCSLWRHCNVAGMLIDFTKQIAIMQWVQIRIWIMMIWVSTVAPMYMSIFYQIRASFHKIKIILSSLVIILYTTIMWMQIAPWYDEYIYANILPVFTDWMRNV